MFVLGLFYASRRRLVDHRPEDPELLVQSLLAVARDDAFVGQLGYRITADRAPFLGS
jgi:hypothetical protein